MNHTNVLAALGIVLYLAVLSKGAPCKFNFFHSNLLNVETREAAINLGMSDLEL